MNVSLSKLLKYVNAVSTLTRVYLLKKDGTNREALLKGKAQYN